MDEQKTCTKCGATFNSDAELMEHMTRAHASDTTQSGGDMETKDEMGGSMDADMGMKGDEPEGEDAEGGDAADAKNVCETCGMSFMSPEDKAAHVRDVHGE